MTDAQSSSLAGWRLLLVEDEYLVAADLAQSLEDAGAEIVGPVGTVEEALAIATSEASRLDGAVLDINLHGKPIYPVADLLTKVKVPFVFATGYDTMAIRPSYAETPRCEKPVDKNQLALMLFKLKH
jgi:CheY-like chemotaxis protein